jgi:hypothetical protein
VLLDRLFSEGKDEGDTFKLYIIWPVVA